MFFKQKQRFSIRKYSFGAASVLLGTVILGMAAPEASADTVQPETQQVLKEENTSVQTSDLSSSEMEAVSETSATPVQETVAPSDDTPVTEPVAQNESSEVPATPVQETVAPSSDTPVAEPVTESAGSEVATTPVRAGLVSSTDTPVAELATPSETPEVDETSAQEDFPAPSALTGDMADKPRVRSARSLADSQADQQSLFEDQNLLEDAQKTLVDKTDLNDYVGGSDAFKPTSGYTEGGKEEQDAYDKAITAGEAVIKDTAATQVAVDMATQNIKEADLRLRLSAAAALVKAAEEAAKAGQAKKEEVEQDATVDEEEGKAVDDLNKKTLGKITSARNVVDLLPEVAEKATLKDRLDKIKTSEVVVGIVGTAVARADLYTKSAEKAARAAAAKKKAVEADGAVNPAEKAEVDALNAEVPNSKKIAEQFVDKLPEGREKNELKDRLSKVTTSEVVVNDFDKDGKADKQDIVEDAAIAVQAADDVAQIVKSKKAAAESDSHVTQEEKTKIDDLNKSIMANKESATSQVDNLPDSPDKAALKKWLDKITTSEVTVGAVDNKVKSDKPDTAIARADFYTTSTESKAKAAAAKKEEVEADGAVNPAEKAEVDALNEKVTKSKKLAEDFVNTSLPEGQDKEGFKARLSKITTSEVKVNDANSNGKSDELDNKISGFENVIRAAEQSVQAAKTKKAQAESDGVVNPSEKAEIDSLNAGITNIKEILKNFIDTLPEIPVKKDLSDRLAKLTTSEVTVGAVSTADNKVKSDKLKKAIDMADFYTTSTEIKAKAAAAKKTAVEADGVVNPAEKQEVDALNAEVTRAKETATKFIDTLPESSETKELKGRLSKVTTSEVKVNDANSNGKSDELDDRINGFERVIKAAEEVAQEAKVKKAQVEADDAVNPAEKAEVDALNEKITQSKEILQKFIDELPEIPEKKEFEERLAKLTISEVKINDADSNGKVDADEAAALDLVKDLLTSAEQIAQSAKTKKAEAEADGVVTTEEKAEIDELNTRITNSQKQLSTALDNVSGTEIPALRERFEKLTTSEVTVGAVDSKEKADNKDEQADAPVATDDPAVKVVKPVEDATNKELSASQKITFDAAKAFTQSAEEAAKEVQEKKTQVESDGTVTAEEKQAVDSLNQKVTQAKSSATQLVNSLPDTHDTAELKARLDKVTTSEVTVGDVESKDKADSKVEQADAPVATDDVAGSTDKADSKEEQDVVPVTADDPANKGGLSDSQKITLGAAEAFTQSAEEAAKEAQNKKTQVESDGTVTAEEKQAVDALNAKVTQAKSSATQLVSGLPDTHDTAELKARLEKVTTSEVTVGDVKSKEKADSKEQQDIVPVVDTDGKDKADSKDEQADAPVATDDATGSTDKVDSKEEQDIVPVVDTDSKDKVDSKVEQAADNTGKVDSQAERDVALIHAQQAVEDAEYPAQSGKDKKTEAEKDGVITPSEKEHLDQIDTIITAAKQHAQSLVDKLPDSDAKKALQERLAKITTSEVTVSDVNNDSKADNKEQQDIVPVVADDSKDKADSKDEQADAPVAAEDTADSKDKVDNKDEQAADNNGKTDSQAEQAAALATAEEAVEDAEYPAQFGKDNKREAEKDGVITPSEKEHLDQIDTIITAAKQHAQSLVDKLPDSDAKKALQARLAKITTSEVTVNDADSNGKADDKERLEKAEDAVKSVEALAQSAKDKKTEVESDGVVNPAEKAEVDRLNEKVTVNKEFVTSLIKDNLPDSPEKAAFMDRLAKITTSEVTVNDANSNGKADSQDKQDAALAAAESAVKAAEAAAKAGQDKKAEVEKDSLVTPAEKTAVDNLNKATADKKSAATVLVDKLPDSDAKKALQERLGKVTTSKVTINDANSNGKADSLDSIIARADFFTTSTERSAQAAKAKKAEVEKDGLVTPAEKQAVDSLNAEVTKSKQAAEKFVDTLPEGKEKNEFKARLGKITTSQVTVNDADSNGKADDQDRLDVAEVAVKAAEAAAKAGQDKKAEVEKDGLVNPLEKTVVDGLNKTTVDKKNVASALVDTLADSADKDALQARLSKVTTSEVTVNDANSNGKADTQDADFATAEAAVKAAEAAAKAGQDKKAEVEADGLVTPAEKTAVDDLNKTTVDKKDVATDLVDGLSDNAAKTALKERLSKVTTSKVTVNDADSNGKADDQDRLEVAEAAVKAAEAAAKAGQDKKAEVEKDGLVNPLEKTVVDGLNKTTVDKKNVASALVDTLADSAAKTALETRLAKVTTSEVTINDANSNGKVDSQDAQEADTATVEPAVKAAEDAAQVAKDKKAEVEADGLVNPAEKEALDELNAIVADSKKHATALVDNLPDSAAKTALQARLAKVTTSEITVNDTDSNGKADDQDRLEVTEAAVKAAEAAAKAGQDKKAEVESDGLVNPLEKTVVDGLNKTTIDKKNVASALVDTLADSAAKTALEARLAKVTTSEVTVNDADSNGKVDSQDTQEAALASAEAAVKSAEAAAKAGQDKKAEVESDGLVTPAEKTAITDLNKTTVDEKDVATDLVDKLPDGAAKTALQARLAKVTTSQVTVNDADSNGIADDQDRLEVAEAAVKAAEAAAKAGQDKKAEVESDGLVNPLEKTVVDGLNKTTVDKKNVASALVDTLPDSSAKTALEARLAKVMISEVTVNDADSNGKVDIQEIEKPQVEPKPDDSPKVEKPQMEPKPGDSPKVEKPQVEPKPGDSPKVEKPQMEPKPGDSPKVEKPQMEPKPGDSPKVEKPQVEPKPGDSPKVEKPQMEPKPGDSPKVEKPQMEPKPGDSPKVEKPQMEPKPGDSPKVEKPQMDPKSDDSPKVEKPQMDPKSGDSDGGITGKAGQTVLPTVNKPAARAISSQPVKKTPSTDTVKGENLPRTGERSNQLASLYGGGMALALATLLASKKHKRNSED